jgi:AcrR family transcriptional regulator
LTHFGSIHGFKSLKTDKASKILEAANQLFAKEGVQAPTARIAREAQVSNGTLFNYFPTKSGLFQALYAFLRAKITEELGKISPEDLTTKDFFFRQWDAYIKWALQNPIDYQTIQLLKKSRMIDQEKIDDEDKIFICLRQLIEQEIVAGRFKASDMKLILQICIGHLDATISYITMSRLETSAREDATRSSFEMLWDGFAASA